MAADDGMADDEGMADEDLAGAAGELEDEDEPHAAAPMARLAASPYSAMFRRCFIVSPSAGFSR
jgi:hypothetical protein